MKKIGLEYTPLDGKTPILIWFNFSRHHLMLAVHAASALRARGTPYHWRFKWK